MASEVLPPCILVVKNTFLEVVEEKSALRCATASTRSKSHGDLADVEAISDGSNSTSPPSMTDDGEQSLSLDACGTPPASPASVWSTADQPHAIRAASPVQRSMVAAQPESEYATMPPWWSLQRTGSERLQHPAATPIQAAQPAASPREPRVQCLSTSPKAERQRQGTDMVNKASAMAHSAHSGTPQEETAAPVEPERRTTVMLRGLPAAMTRTALLALLDSQGFRCCYDFAYLPIDFCAAANLGYAFVNLHTPSLAVDCFRHFDGLAVPPQRHPDDGRRFGSPTSLSCTWSDHQGFEVHVEKYRSSPVMHPSIPDAWKPIILSDGCRVPFPRPTKHIKAPRQNKLRAEAAQPMAAGPVPAGVRAR